MELLESLLVNKKNFRILAFIYIVIVILVLLWIWWPKSTQEVASYEPYNETTKNKEMVNYYLNFVDNLKRYGTEDVFEDYIDYGYLKYTNTKLSEAINKLKATDDSYVLENFEVYKNGDSHIYSMSIPSGSNSLKINIVEKNYPYNFCITYDTFVAYSDLWNYGSMDGAVVKTTGTYQTLDYIEYELTVENVNYENLTLDFTKATNFKLVTEEGSAVSLNMVQSSQGKVSAAKGETTKVKLVFDIEIEEQSNLASISISGITADALTETVEIDL